MRARGGDVTTDDCASADRFSSLIPSNVGETTVCFMAGKLFKPDGLRISHVGGIDSAHPVYYNTDKTRCLSADKSNVHECASAHQVVPFHNDSIYCFDEWFDPCNADNVQRVDGSPAPRPAPEPEPESEPAELLHTLYDNRTGTLTLVFSQLVVALNPDRIHLVHDIDAFIEDGNAPNLGDASLGTVDGKRQSSLLAFTLPDALRLEVTQSLREHGDLALWIEPRAVYAADGFVDIIMPDRSPILVPDVAVVQ